MVAGSSHVDMCRTCNEPMANSQDYPVSGHNCGEQARERRRKADQGNGPPRFKEPATMTGLRGPLLADIKPGEIISVQAPIYPQGMNKEQWRNHVALRVLEGRYAGGLVEKGVRYAEVAKMSYDQAGFFIAEGEKRKDQVK